ncbi:MAG: class I SAM-dependent methyltransferase [Clostridia bacterium]|nr:class I SAM-dependent methyltransferase [Clostridia bacterium]
MEKNMISNPWDDDYKDNEKLPIYEPLWDMLQLFLKSVSVKTVLDFGCGDGIYSFLMGKSGVNVLGIDISTKAIEKAKLHKERYGDERCSFICYNSIPDNLPSDSFDAVVMLNSYHCLINKERSRIVAQINRVLKKNGYLFTSVLALEDESYPRDDWKEIEKNTFDDGKGRIFHFFSSDELSAEFKGLEILDNTMLQNVHPEIGRKSALYVITAKKTGTSF